MKKYKVKLKDEIKQLKVKLKDEVKKLLIEKSSGEIFFNNKSVYYPKYFAEIDVFTVINDYGMYIIIKPDKASGMYIHKCHTTPYDRFQITIDDKVFE